MDVVMFSNVRRTVVIAAGLALLAVRATFGVRAADEIGMRAKTKRLKRPGKKTKRPIGLPKGKVKITKSFFKPLPNELLEDFEGKK